MTLSVQGHLYIYQIPYKKKACTFLVTCCFLKICCFNAHCPLQIFNWADGLYVPLPSTLLLWFLLSVCPVVMYRSAGETTVSSGGSRLFTLPEVAFRNVSICSLMQVSFTSKLPCAEGVTLKRKSPPFYFLFF